MIECTLKDWKMIYRSIRLEQEGVYIITKYNPADSKILNILIPIFMARRRLHRLFPLEGKCKWVSGCFMDLSCQDVEEEDGIYFKRN